MGRSRKQLLAFGVTAIAATAGVLALAVWLIVRDEVASLRPLAANHSAPVPPRIAAAILAAEGRGFRSPPSLRSCLPPPPGVLRCGPPPVAFALIRRYGTRLPPSRLPFENAVTAYVVSRLFTPDALFRVYAHELYLGNVGRQLVRGVEAASRTYFGKTAGELTTAEAATIAAMIRSPNAYSPLRFPLRARARRNRVLEAMRHDGFIDQAEYQRSIAEPLLVGAPALSAASRSSSIPVETAAALHSLSLLRSSNRTMAIRGTSGASTRSAIEH